MRNTAQRKSLIPPRLSLQSKVLLAVRPEQSDEHTLSSTGEEANMQEHTASQVSTEDSCHPNVLTRFAQRLTASLSAFGMTSQPDTLPDLPPPSPGEAQRLSQQREHSLLPPSPLGEPAQTDEASGELSSEEQTTPSVDPVRPDIHKQRSAGYISKIRLQTAAIPVTPRPVTTSNSGTQKEPPSPRLATPDHLRTDSILALDLSKTDESTTDRHPSTMDPLSQRGRETNTGEHIPVEQRLVRVESLPLTLFGGGVFESGQADVTIEEPLITDKSVVMVTLTSNPGPVVVQYISLNPLVGFTVHLTAPASKRTTFNYVVLEGER